MKFESNKKYIAQNGRTVRLICTDRKSKFPIVGLYDNGEYETMIAYYPDGTTGEPFHNWNLIAEGE